MERRRRLCLQPELQVPHAVAETVEAAVIAEVTAEAEVMPMPLPLHPIRAGRMGNR